MDETKSPHKVLRRGDWSLLSFNGSNFSDSTLTGFSSPPNAGAAKFSTAVDFEGDGIYELAAWSEWDGTWTIFNQNGQATPLGMWADRALSLSGGEIIDVNGDAQLDVVYWDRESGRWFAGVSDGQSITFSYVAQWTLNHAGSCRFTVMSTETEQRMSSCATN